MYTWPSSLPEQHKHFISNALSILSPDPRLAGIAASGSFCENKMDEFSDIDLIIAVEPEKHQEIMAERNVIADSLGQLLSGFSGEHVGEPRVYICLYGPEPLHVDLKFVPLQDVVNKVDQPIVLWQKDNRLKHLLEQNKGHYPHPEPQWVEDRFWVWVHYAATKIGRGELFEAIEFLGFLRTSVLVPMIQVRSGLEPQGIRKVEATDKILADKLLSTLAIYDRTSIVDALHACIEMYRNDCVTPADSGVTLKHKAQRSAMTYLNSIAARIE